MQDKVKAPIDGVHAKPVPKYSKRASSTGVWPVAPSPKNRKNQRVKAPSPFQEAQRNWYAQKTLQNKRFKSEDAD